MIGIGQTSVRLVRLHNFRSYAHFEVSLNPKSMGVAILGVNGAGKSNLLEAVSLLSSGKGLKQSSWRDMMHRPLQHETGLNKPGGWTVDLTVEHSALIGSVGGHKHQSFVQMQARQTEKATMQEWDVVDREKTTMRRIVSMDGHPTTPEAIANVAPLLWMAPHEAYVGMMGSAARVKLMDRWMQVGESSMEAWLEDYEKAMRERRHMLEQGQMSGAWLDALEDQMVKAATLINHARQGMIEWINHHLSMRWMDDAPYYLTRIVACPKDNVEESEALRSAYRVSRNRDALSGRTMHGPHRWDYGLEGGRHGLWEAGVWQEGSAGQQKMLVLGLMLAVAAWIEMRRQVRPVLILDDVTASLDTEHRRALFSHIASQGCHTWVSASHEDELNDIAINLQPIWVRAFVA